MIMLTKKGGVALSLSLIGYSKVNLWPAKPFIPPKSGKRRGRATF